MTETAPALIGKPLELVHILSLMPAYAKATLVSVTKVKLNKRNRVTGEANPFGEIRKIQTTKVELNRNYSDAVNEQRTEEGVTADFVAQSRKWGTRLNDSVIFNKGKLYIQFMQIERDANATYIDQGGNEIPVELLRPFFPPYSPPKTQGVDDTVECRSYHLESIFGIIQENGTVLYKEEIR